MSLTTLIGTAVVVVALATLIFLTLWSRRTIDRIAAGRAKSAREIQKELDRGRR